MLSLCRSSSYNEQPGDDGDHEAAHLQVCLLAPNDASSALRPIIRGATTAGPREHDDVGDHLTLQGVTAAAVCASYASCASSRCLRRRVPVDGATELAVVLRIPSARLGRLHNRLGGWFRSRPYCVALTSRSSPTIGLRILHATHLAMK